MSETAPPTTMPVDWYAQRLGISPSELIRLSPLSLALYGLDGELVASSDRWRSIAPETPANAIAFEAARAERLSLFQACLKGESRLTAPIRLEDERGAVRWMCIELGPWPNHLGEIAHIVAQGWDITEAMTSRDRAERAEERLTAALAIDRMIVMEHDMKTGETIVSGDCPELAMIAEHTIMTFDHVHPDDRPALLAQVAAAWQKEDPGVFRFEYRLNCEEPRWVSTISKTEFDEAGAPHRTLIVFQEITDRVVSRQETERLAFNDALTGLPNRAMFQREFDLAVEEAERLGRPLALVMVDVDHFKDINDALGHDAGDALLKELAGQLRKAFRGSDLVARLGGDEFAILLRDCGTEADMVRPLEALRAALAVPVNHRGQGFKISTSIGAALHNDPDADAQHLLKNADIALYKAKEGGRDQIVLFQPQMRSEVEQRLELLRDVRLAIPKGEFNLFYQPVVSLSGEGSVAGFEALMRWTHPDHGVLTPAYFMAALEDQDLSLQLGDVVIEAALKQMREWLDQDLPFGRVSINLSAAQFRTGRLAKDLQSRLQYWGVPADRLTVEVTENVYLGWGAEIVAETVKELHDHGVTIALDDFGTGYASLANLRQFPIDRLKIDKSFVQNAEDDAIVRAVINLGASMGMEVVAEGVEKLEQLTALSRYGCGHVQGFHFAKPMPPAEVPGYLRAFQEAAKSGKSAA